MPVQTCSCMRGETARGAEEVATSRAIAWPGYAASCWPILANPAEQDRLVEAAWDWRPIDIWINNAGADVLTGDAANWSFEEKLAALWKVDVVATLRLSRAVGQRMHERGHGVILNMGWDQADTGMAGDSGEFFAAVKGARDGGDAQSWRNRSLRRCV